MSFWQDSIPAVCFGVTAGIVGVHALQLISDLIGTRTQSSAFVYGVMSLADKIFNGVVAMLVQSCQPARDSPELGPFQRDVFALIPAAVCVLGILLLGLLRQQGFPGPSNGPSRELGSRRACSEPCLPHRNLKAYMSTET